MNTVKKFVIVVAHTLKDGVHQVIVRPIYRHLRI